MRLERRNWRGPLWGRPWRLRWPVSGGCPRRMFGSALRWGRGWRSQRRAAAWLGACGVLCPQWGWRGWCSQWCPQGLGLGHPVLQTRMPERGQPYQTPCSGDVPTTCSGDVLATFQWPLERRQNVAYGGLWGPMGFYGDLWGPMGTFGHLWGPMGTFGDLWAPMGMGADGDSSASKGTYGGL